MNLNSARQSVMELLLLKPPAQDIAPRPNGEADMKAPANQNKERSNTKPRPKRAEYRVIEGPNGIAELELRVNDKLKQGWKLIGGICFDRGCPYQAMARITSEPMEPTGPAPTLE